MTMVMVLNMTGQHNEAHDYHKRALRVIKNYSDYAGASSLLANIGMIYKKKRKYDDALFFSKDLLK